MRTLAILALLCGLCAAQSDKHYHYDRNDHRWHLKTRDIDYRPSVWAKMRHGITKVFHRRKP